MSIKIFIICMCTAVGTAAGYAVMYRYKRTKEYFKSLCDMLDELKRNISFRRDSVASVLGTFETKSALLKRNIAQYLAFSTNKNGVLDIDKGFLKPDEHGKITKMFSILGGSDEGTQSRDIDMYLTEFSALRDAAQQRYDKYGTLAVKLGFLFGLGVGILFL